MWQRSLRSTKEGWVGGSGVGSALASAESRGLSAGLWRLGGKSCGATGGGETGVGWRWDAASAAKASWTWALGSQPDTSLRTASRLLGVSMAAATMSAGMSHGYGCLPTDGCLNIIHNVCFEIIAHNDKEGWV